MLTRVLAIIGLLIIWTPGLSNDSQIGKVIVLTGPSCAGKSTIAAAIQKNYPTMQWHVVSFGEFRQTILADKAKELQLIKNDYINTNNIVLDQIVRHNLLTYNGSDFLQKQTDWQNIFIQSDELFAKHVQILIQNGVNLIIDMPMYQEHTVKVFMTTLEKFHPFLVFVHLPFEQLAARISTRNKVSNEYRYINQVVQRYFLYYWLYSDQKENYLEVMSKKLTSALIESWGSQYECSKFIPCSTDLATQLFATLTTNIDQFYLSPRLVYDLIVNTDNITPDRIATQIQMAFSNYIQNMNFIHNINYNALLA